MYSDPKNHKSDAPRPPKVLKMRSKQVPEITNFMKKSKKVKSNENATIYNTFDRLGHHKSAEFPFKNHENPWLHTKHVF